MIIQEYRIHLRYLDDHKCPGCAEKLERRPRCLWQKAVSFALPLRHYKCSACYQRFFAFSPAWNQMPFLEKGLRLLVTVVVLLTAVALFFAVLFRILFQIMA